MKWGPLEPVPGGHDFRDADRFMDFAQQNQMEVRGHTLIWFASNPRWLPALLNPANADSILKRHIEVAVGRYRGRIKSWDVVNEVVEPKDGRADGLRKDIWLTMLGPEYIAKAFRYARASDPKAVLVYNEYGVEMDTPAAALRRTAVLALLKKLVADGVPIDAFGFQLHIEPSVPFDVGKLNQLIDQISSLGLRILITEVDVDERDLPGNIAWRDAMVAAAYSRYLKPFLAHPAVEGITTWGLVDTFNRDFPRPDGLPARGMLLDANYQRKPSWAAVAAAIDARPCVPVDTASFETLRGAPRGPVTCQRPGAR